MALEITNQNGVFVAVGPINAATSESFRKHLNSIINKYCYELFILLLYFSRYDVVKSSHIVEDIFIRLQPVLLSSM